MIVIVTGDFIEVNYTPVSNVLGFRDAVHNDLKLYFPRIRKACQPNGIESKKTEVVRKVKVWAHQFPYIEYVYSVINRRIDFNDLFCIIVVICNVEYHVPGRCTIIKMNFDISEVIKKISIAICGRCQDRSFHHKLCNYAAKMAHISYI